ncbi:MAG: hypothetical protein AB7F79_07925 [Steroidobacteraceae bacterium]
MIHLEPQDITSDYWRAYLEWRANYGLSDDCIKELLAAIRVEIAADTTSPEQQRQLRKLAAMIEVELEDDQKARQDMLPKLFLQQRQTEKRVR